MANKFRFVPITMLAIVSRHASNCKLVSANAIRPDVLVSPLHQSHSPSRFSQASFLILSWRESFMNDHLETTPPARFEIACPPSECHKATDQIKSKHFS